VKAVVFPPPMPALYTKMHLLEDKHHGTGCQELLMLIASLPCFPGSRLQNSRNCFLLITPGVPLSQVSPMRPFIGLYIHKTAIRVSYCIKFFTTDTAVSGSFCHSIYFKL